MKKLLLILSATTIFQLSARTIIIENRSSNPINTHLNYGANAATFELSYANDLAVNQTVTFNNDLLDNEVNYNLDNTRKFKLDACKDNVCKNSTVSLIVVNKQILLNAADCGTISSTDLCLGNMSSWITKDTSKITDIKQFAVYCTPLNAYLAKYNNILSLWQEFENNSQAFNDAQNKLTGGLKFNTKAKGQQNCMFFLDKDNAKKDPEDLKEVPQQCTSTLNDLVKASEKLFQSQKDLINALSDPQIGCININSSDLKPVSVKAGENVITLYDNFPGCEVSKAIAKMGNTLQLWQKKCSDFNASQK